MNIKFGMEISSLSDRGQDKWVVEIFELKKKKFKGFFLEIGGGDGFCNSNTFILEKYHNWKGILVEPNPKLYYKLTQNRPNCETSNQLVYEDNLELKFQVNGELSKVVHNTEKKVNNIITIKSIKLEELLDKYNAPNIIHFFSLDVEGCEDKVLTKKILDKYNFMSLCIERPSIKLHQMLLENNYVFIKSKIYDCFYLNKSFENLKDIKKKKFVDFDLK